MKEPISIRIDPAIKARMDKARKVMAVKESQTLFIEAAIDQRCKRITRGGTV